MGYGVVPDIKDERVVCQQPCEHRDCASNRAEWADAKCVICGKPMLAGQNFYYGDIQKHHEHAGCAHDQAQKESDEMNKKKGR